MNIDNIQEQINKLPISNNNDFFLKFRPTMSEEYAKSLVGKNIYFKWHHIVEDENIIENISGKVLEYDNNHLLVYTNYITVLEEDINNPELLENNELIKNIPITDITDIAEFTNYMFKGWEILPEDYYKNIYEITNMDNKSIIVAPYDCDGFDLYFAVKYNVDGNIKIEKKTYPLYLIKSMKEGKNKMNNKYEKLSVYDFLKEAKGGVAPTKAECEVLEMMITEYFVPRFGINQIVEKTLSEKETLDKEYIKELFNTAGYDNLKLEEGLKNVLLKAAESELQDLKSKSEKDNN